MIVIVNYAIVEIVSQPGIMNIVIAIMTISEKMIGNQQEYK